MPKMEISFHCMIGFVAGETSVHALMPATGRGEGCAGHPTEDAGLTCEKHVVRLMHYFSNGMGIPMEGWNLVLGSTGADTSLIPTHPSHPPRELADISHRCGLSMKDVVVISKVHPKIASRVTLLSGHLESLSAETEWEFDGASRWLAFKATWVIDDIDQSAIKWESIGATGPEPVPHLAQLPVEGDRIKLRIYHTLESALPDTNEPSLTAHVVQSHFRAFYGLLTDSEISDDWLPQSATKTNLSCLLMKAEVDPPVPLT